MKHIQTFEEFLNESFAKNRWAIRDMPYSSEVNSKIRQELLKKPGGIGEDDIVFTVDDEKLDRLLNSRFSRQLDFQKVKGDEYYVLSRKEFDRFIDLGDSSGFDVDYDNSENSVVYVIESIVNEANVPWEVESLVDELSQSLANRGLWSRTQAEKFLLSPIGKEEAESTLKELKGLKNHNTKWDKIKKEVIDMILSSPDLPNK